MNQSIPDGCIPFDLERYKAGYPARTRDGKAIEFAAHSPKNPNDNDRVVSVLDDGTWVHTTEEGTWQHVPGSGLDIFLVAPKPKWVPWDNVDEVPDGAWFRHKETGTLYLWNFIKPSENTVGWTDARLSMSALFHYYEWHRDRRHKGPWNVCGKVAK